jgi:hypothetical protein
MTLIMNKSDYEKVSVKDNDSSCSISYDQITSFNSIALTRDFVICYQSKVVNFTALNSKLDPGQLSHWSD